MSKKITKNLAQNIIFPVCLMLITFLVWKHIPDLQILGEGFYYFVAGGFTIGDPFAYDMFAGFIFKYLQVALSDRISLYMWLCLGIMLFTDIVFYFTSLIITKNKIVAMFASLLFTTSYIGQYDIFSSGGYQYLLQRAVTLAPILIAFSLLVLHFNKGFKARYYLGSLYFYFLALFMGFFTTWFLMPFLLFPVFSVLLKHRSSLYKLFLAAPFLIGNYLLIKSNPYAKHEDSLLEFIHEKWEFILYGITQQLSVITIDREWYNKLTELLMSLNILNIVPQTMWYLNQNGTMYVVLFGLPVTASYLFGLVYIWKKQPDDRVIAVTLLLSLIAMLVFNLYLNSANVLTSFGSSRYFYFPVTMISIFWGIFLGALWKSNRSFKWLALVLCAVVVVSNIYSTHKNLNVDMVKHSTTKEILRILKKWSPALKQNPSYVYLPAYLSAYGSSFVFHFYSHPNGHFVLDSFEKPDPYILIQKGISPDNVYVLTLENEDHVVDTSIEIRSKMIEILKKGKTKQ